MPPSGTIIMNPVPMYPMGVPAYGGYRGVPGCPSCGGTGYKYSNGRLCTCIGGSVDIYDYGDSIAFGLLMRKNFY
jgi:hypothetical protein